MAALWRLVVVAPLRYLYDFGPAFGGWGFWEGRPPEDACAEITGVSASFWAQQQAPCFELLDRKFHAGMALAAVAGYGLALVWGVWWAAVWLGLYLPLRRELVRLRRPPE